MTTLATKSARKKVLEVAVHSDYRVPAVYKTGVAEDIEEALTLGAKIQEQVRSQRASEDVKRAVAEKEAELTTVLEEQQAELKERQEQIASYYQELQTLRSQLQTSIQSHRQEMMDLDKDVRKQERDAALLEMEEKIRTAEHRCRMAEERKEQMELLKEKEVRVAEERVQQFMQKIVQVREEQVQASQAAVRALEDAYKRQSEELKSLNDFLRRKITNVKTKGNEYEMEFRERLLTAFGTGDGFSLLDTARNGVGHAGDFLMQWGSHTILWEVKNYDKPVPKSEVEKFQRDMLENKAVRVGVMVSRSTEITGKTSTGDRELEFLEGKLLIYLSRFEFMGDEQITLQSLLPLFRIWWESTKEEEESAQLHRSIRDLEKIVADLTKKRQEWRVHKNRMEDSMRWMSEMVEDAEQNVEHVLRTLQKRTIVSEEPEIPEGIFRSSFTDEKMRNTIQWILQLYEISPTSEIRLSDMADKVSQSRSVSRDCARKYILAALQDTAVYTAPGKPTIVRGFSVKPPS